MRRDLRWGRLNAVGVAHPGCRSHIGEQNHVSWDHVCILTGFRSTFKFALERTLMHAAHNVLYPYKYKMRISSCLGQGQKSEIEARLRRIVIVEYSLGL
jgi:hypothetical protein